MDRKVVMLKELMQLQSIAKLSAVTVLEFDHFIKLAMMVERYVQNQCSETFDEMVQSLTDCMTSFPRYHESRQYLLNSLITSGFITLINQQDDSATTHNVDMLEPIEELTNRAEVKSNVIKLFNHVDK